MGQDIQLSSQQLSLQEKLESLPSRPGVYQFKNAEGKEVVAIFTYERLE